MAQRSLQVLPNRRELVIEPSIESARLYLRTYTNWSSEYRNVYFSEHSWS